ncbi:MAG TPA: hypothetical protein VKZ74_01935 [Natronosporangium sp.]|nr:hypothetical protein [Natronosporangium sp.]
MADGDTTLLAERLDPAGAEQDDDGADHPDPAVPSGLVASLKSFAAAHTGATAVIEYVGRRGARIVLIGGDGTWGDQFASATDVARRACARAGVRVENSWERELIAQMRPAPRRRRDVARRTLAR